MMKEDEDLKLIFKVYNSYKDPFLLVSESSRKHKYNTDRNRKYKIEI